MRIGLLADTHGYLGEDTVAALAGCDAILHAGDVGPGVLPRLAGIAPLTAVRGNNDTAGPEAALPGLGAIVAGGRRVTVVHRLADAPAEGWDVLVFGHSHRQLAEVRDGRLILNPGAAGRRGFHTVRSLALLDLDGAAGGEEGAFSWRFVDLGPRSAAR